MKSIMSFGAWSPLALAGKFFRNSCRGLVTGLALTVSVVLAPGAQADSGHVLPPEAKPLGYSLTDMAAEVANFSISGNDPEYYPDVPFEILYTRPDRTFRVSPGTYLYIKFFFIDDAEPVFGDWPEDASEAGDYLFGPTQIGAHDFEVEVDGVVTSLDDPGYIGGPVPTPDSPDGSDNLLQVGAFVSPLKKGTHTVTIRGVVDGDAFVEAVGFTFVFERTYTIIVE